MTTTPDCRPRTDKAGVISSAPTRCGDALFGGHGRQKRSATLDVPLAHIVQNLRDSYEPSLSEKQLKKTILILAVTSVVSAAARADDPAPSPLTANINVTTNYKFRGQDQGNVNPDRGFSPAIQGGFDYSMNGFYVGNWNSSIGWISEAGVNSHIEMDFYGGYRGEIGAGFGYDVGILQYYYPHGASFNVTELYAAVTYSFLSLKYSGTVSKDYFGYGHAFKDANALSDRPSGRGTGYLDLTGNYEVIKGLTANGHVGYTRYASDLRDQGLPGYFDYRIGATYDLGSGFSLAGAIVGANKRSFYGDINKARVIATISKTM